MGKRLNTEKLLLALAVAALVVVGILPLGALLWESARVEGRFSLANYTNLLFTVRSWTLLGRSVLLASLTTAASMAFGLPLGWLLGRTDLPFRGFFSVVLTFPFLLPPYVLAVSWAGLWGLGGLAGCVFVLGSAFMPIVMLLTMASLAGVNPRLEEAARLSARWPRVVWRVTWPLIRPGLALAAALVFLLSLGELSVPLFLRYNVFPVEMLTQFSAFYNIGAAATAGVPLALIAGGILFLKRRDAGRAFHFRTGVAEEETGRVPLGKAGPWIAAGTAAFCVVVVGLPFLGLARQAGSPAAFGEAFRTAGDSLWRSLATSFIGATLLSAWGFLLGWLIHRRSLRLWRVVDFILFFLFAVPGAVLGVAMIGFWNHPGLPVYGTPLIVLMGLLAQYIALPGRFTAAALSQIPDSLDEAARVAGVSWGRRVRRLILPLAKRGLAAGWLVGFLFCLRDMGASLLLYPPGQDGLAVRTFTLMANGAPSLIAALCLLMAATALVPFGVLSLVLRKGVP